ncbi:hypothetical protein CFC21_039809 [Triticum aestivum]|uniref:BTB domain-containing protein n=2 Tax=Triticum aestivum TaxID=4565 RepID=A0A9R1FFL6_WHEAT|nr:BTB/POZ and MATH domain-containing protein 2-like [Triticum aestivum]KAF7027799.1 hypothetical protein CFC21_039809 [Triticum aestivum]CDM84150.1 unnamed protein product [Triticum aestivum]
MATCRRWELPLPDTLRGLHRLDVYCKVPVLWEDTDIPKNADQISMVSPPTISRDLGKLVMIQGEGEPQTKLELSRRHCMLPDVTFIIEQTEIHAHKTALSMRSPVFAAQFRWHTTESTARVHDISASTFRAMLHFIYTDQLELKSADGGRVAMALDLLVAADRYDIGSLRLMCENILSESMGVVSVMSTLMEVHGRHSCRAVEALCIEYMASDPAVYAAVKATEDYKELKESCYSSVLEVVEKVAAVNMAHNMCSNAPSSSSSRPQMNAATYYSLEVVEGTHKFKIPGFLFVQRRHGVGKEISSEAFQVGGYSWKIKVYPSSSSEKAQGHISVYAELLTDPGTEGVNVTLGFKLDGHSGQSRHLIKWSEKTFTTKSDRGYAKFVTVEAAKSWHLARDASLTVCCDVAITKKVYTSTTSTSTVGTGAPMPLSNITSHLKQLLVSEHGSDVRFLVENIELRVVIAARLPTLCEMMMMGMKDGDGIPVDGVTVAVFKAVLHFIYTDELPPIQDLTHDGAAQDEVMIAEDMLVEACWFGLGRIKAMCENLLAGLIDLEEDALSTLEPVSDLQCSNLRDYCNQFIASMSNYIIVDSSQIY